MLHYTYRIEIYSKVLTVPIDSYKYKIKICWIFIMFIYTLKYRSNVILTSLSLICCYLVSSINASEYVYIHT